MIINDFSDKSPVGDLQILFRTSAAGRVETRPILRDV